MSAAVAVAGQRVLGWGGRAAALCRGLRTGPPRLQDSAGAAAKETEKQSATEQSSSILQRNSMRWDGKVYEEVPIAHIKATYNNTHIQVVSFDNQPFARTSCGTEGFQNAKKGTAIAAQTAAMAAAVKARGKGVLHVRVLVKGLGPGRKVGVDHGRFGGHLHHRQQPGPPQRLPPTEGQETVRGSARDTQLSTSVHQGLS
uniref:Mitochondrial ribosomal protein S11 n=1 Tax=Corvus moneduloides TaxID=1196302 RepID=A0A8C3EBU3_CORMO